MNAKQRLNPFPGFAILEPHDLKRKIGAYELPQEDSENAPQVGKIIDIGKVPAEITAKIKEWKLNEKEAAEFLATYRPFEVGMVVAYKKYQDFPIQLGTKKYIAVGFEHLLFEIKDSDV